MESRFDAGALLKRVRAYQGLTQRGLAARAGTAQSVVARIENGQTSPTVTTLNRLLASAGYMLESRISPASPLDTHMLDDVARILAMTPEERLVEVRNVNRWLAGAERV